jgi:hypothetical protein
MKLPNLVLVILSVFDIVTTWIILEHGGKELNPLMAPLGILGIIVVRIIFVIGAIYLIENYFIPHFEKHPMLKYAPLVAYCGISTIWLAAVLNNLFYIVPLLK